MNPAHEGRGSPFSASTRPCRMRRDFFFSHGRRPSALCYEYKRDFPPCIPCRAMREASLRSTTSQRAVRHPTVSTRATRVPFRETATPSFRVRCNHGTKRSTRRPNASGPHIGTHGFAVSQQMQRPTQRACAEVETQARRHAGRQGHNTRRRKAHAMP